MKNVLIREVVVQVRQRWWLYACIVSVMLLSLALTNAKAYQQSPWSYKDLEILKLKDRIADLEAALMASCLKRERDPALNEPMRANEGE